MAIRRISLSLVPVLATATLMACGSKPKPVPAPPAPSTTAAPTTAPEPAPGNRTAGGVELVDVSDEVREAALTLAKSRRAAVPKLVGYGAAARDAVVALLSSQNLEELQGALEIVALPEDPTGARNPGMAKVVELLGHPSELVRDAAAKAAEQATDPSVFIELAKSATSAEVKLRAVRLLGGWDGDAVTDALLPLLADDGLAMDVVLALSGPGKAAPAKVAEALTALVADDVSDARLHAGIVGLRRLGKAVPAAAAERAVKAEDDALAAEGVRASPPEALLALGTSPRPVVLRTLAEELHRAEPGEARTKLLAELVAHTDAAVRAATALTLVKTGAGTGPELDKLLDDGDMGVRRAAIAASAALPPEQAAPRLIERLGKVDAEDKTFVVWVLATVPGRQSAVALVDLLPEKQAGTAALLALSQRAGKELPKEREPWMAWVDEQFPAEPKPDAVEPKPEDKPMPKPPETVEPKPAPK